MQNWNNQPCAYWSQYLRPWHISTIPCRLLSPEWIQLGCYPLHQIPVNSERKRKRKHLKIRTYCPETIVGLHSLMQFSIDERVLSLHSNLEPIFLDFNCQHFRFQLATWHTQLLRGNDDLKVGKCLSPCIPFCWSTIENGLLSSALIILLFLLFVLWLLSFLWFGRFAITGDFRSTNIICSCCSSILCGFFLSTSSSFTFFLFLFSSFRLFGGLTSKHVYQYIAYTWISNWTTVLMKNITFFLRAASASSSAFFFDNTAFDSSSSSSIPCFLLYSDFR